MLPAFSITAHAFQHADTSDTTAVAPTAWVGTVGAVGSVAGLLAGCQWLLAGWLAGCHWSRSRLAVWTTPNCAAGAHRMAWLRSLLWVLLLPGSATGEACVDDDAVLPKGSWASCRAAARAGACEAENGPQLVRQACPRACGM